MFQRLKSIHPRKFISGARAVEPPEPAFAQEFAIVRARVGPRGKVYIGFVEDAKDWKAQKRQRHLSALDEALAYKKLVEGERRLSRSAIARMSGVTRARISQVLAILNLDPEILEYVASIRDSTAVRFFTERRLRRLLGIRDQAERLLQFSAMREQLSRLTTRAGVP